MSVAQDALEATYHKRRAIPLRIVGVRRRASSLVALTATYGLRGDKSVPTVAAGVSQVWLNFIDRLWELCRHEKYFPVRGIDTDERFFDVDRATEAFELCARCKPTCVIYPQWMQKRLKFRSCGHSNFCPACWASVVMRQYQQYKQLINAFIRPDTTDRLFVTNHIVERFVSVSVIDTNQHADHVALTAAIDVIKTAIDSCKQHMDRPGTHKFLQRNTLASYWRIVGIPVEGGLRLQLRRLYVTRPGKKIPTDAPAKMKKVLKRTVLISGGKTWKERKIAEADDELAELMIAFSEYPLELLREDLDLTAAYLNATAKQRLIGGTGKFKCAGDALIKRLRLEDQKRKNNHAAQKPA